MCPPPPGTAPQGFRAPPKSFLESGICSLPEIAHLRALSQVSILWGHLVPRSTPRGEKRSFHPES